jgi:hypothetical protein
MREFHAGIRAASQERRATNRKNSAALLKERGIEFEVRSAGVHLILKDYHFWPGTGLWISRTDNDDRGRGVFQLLKRLARDAKEN